MANSAQFGILNTFDHNLQTWKTYKGRITHYFLANDITASTDSTGSKRKAILLSALTEGTYKLATDLVLPKGIENVPYADLLNVLDAHFTPNRIGFAERHSFYAASQRTGETHPQWAARLRGLTEKCGFLNVEEALRDRFLMGMLPGQEKEKLYTKDLVSLSMAEVVKMAENMSCARAAAASASAPAASAADNQLFKISRDVKNATVGKVKCSVCGYSNHKSSECRFTDYVCKKCHEKGHLRRMCTKKVNYVELDRSDKGEDDAGDDGKLFYIRSFRGQPMVESVLINKLSLKFEIDSGSAVTVIPESFYKSKFIDVPLSSTNKQLMTYNGKKIICLGTLRLPVCYADQSHYIDIFVVRDGGPPLLGRDFISLFNLQLMPVNSINTELSPDLLQQRFGELFSDKLGNFNKYKVKLKLKENAKPVFCKARPVAFALREKVDREIDRLIELGILEPVECSAHASPIVPVLKRDGSVRLCADYSVSINKQLLVEQYPLPTTNELFSKISGGQQFTKLDLSMAYNQFMLDDESKNLTTVNTSRGLLRYNRLVFGLASGPSIFQRAIEGVLSGIDGVLCLLDDILITGTDKKEHMQRLITVLQRLQDAGLTLRKDKCSFFQNEVCYLGYIITKEGLKKSPEKIKAMVGAPVPTNVTQLQSFLGLINYYRNFVPNASTVLSPLYELLKKGSKWFWTDKHQQAFIEIKNLMTSDQVLAHFDPNAKIILTVDASPSGLGAILSQVGDEGTERPISFVSRTLNAAETRYSQIQKEATAIIYGVRRFHQYLYGRSIPFVLRTDHKPLLTIFGPNKGIPEMSANRLQRYALFLSSYNYKIEYVRSADNSADYLSRASLERAVHECACTDRCQCCDCEVAYDRATYVCFVMDGTPPLTLDQLRAETGNDELLKLVKGYVIKGWPPKLTDVRIKAYYLCRSQLSVENGCIMRGHKVVIPTSLYKTVLSELHRSHLGIVKTKAEARSRFWFPGIDQAIEAMISSCDVCIQLRPSPPRAPPAPWEYPTTAFYRIHLDFLGPIKSCMYLVVVDAHTKWVEVYNMNSATSSAAVIGKLCDFFSRFGIPNTIVSDNGTSFCSREFEMFCSTNGISHVTSPVYHPPSNGQAESVVKIVKRGIKSCLLSCAKMVKSSTDLKLLRYLMDYRNSVHTTTGLSPAEMVYGHKLRSRLDIINPKSSSSSPSSSVSNRVQHQQCLQTNQKAEHIIQDLKINEVVLYKKFVNKSNYTWCKGIITKKIGKVVYLVKNLENSETVKRHINQLVKYKGTTIDLEDTINVNIPVYRPLPSSFSASSSPSPPASPPPSPASPSLTSPPCLPPPTPTQQSDLSSTSTNSPVEAETQERGRREELYEANDSPSETDYYEVSADKSVGEEEFYEAEEAGKKNSEEPEPMKETGSAPQARSMRNRPTISYKKFF